MPDIVLTTLNAKYIHAAFGLRYLLANLGPLRANAGIVEFDINQRPIDIAETLLASVPKIIGFGVYIWNVAPTTEVVAAIKRVRPEVTLILGAYTKPREAYGKIIPLFQKFWKDKTGQDVEFHESYLGSGAQSRAILAGFEADVAALAIEPDLEILVGDELVRHDWKSAPHRGIDNLLSNPADAKADWTFEGFALKRGGRQRCQRCPSARRHAGARRRLRLCLPRRWRRPDRGIPPLSEPRSRAC